MKPKDRVNYIKRYENRFRIYGYSHKTLGWGKHGRQNIRFSVLSEPLLKTQNTSLLDVGCGFGDLYKFLIKHNWKGKYVGIDIVPSLIKVGKENHPNLDFRLCDLSDFIHLYPNERYDFVIASGVFNAKLLEEDNLQHIKKSLEIMFKISNKCVCVDFLSSNVDFKKPGAFHTNPMWVLEIGFSLSNRVLLRHDYMPYEFALFIYSEQNISQKNVFLEFEKSITG